MRSYLAFGYIALLGLFSASLAHSAIQGEPGETNSVAIATIRLNIEPNLQISNVSDIELSVTDRTQDVTFEERVCVRGNIGSRYSVIAASQDGSAQPFELTNETGAAISFDVYFRGDLSQSARDQLQPGENSPYYDMRTIAKDCNGDDTASFTVIFRTENLMPAPPGTYSGFLTLTVAAE